MSAPTPSTGNTILDTTSTPTSAALLAAVDTENSVGVGSLGEGISFTAAIVVPPSFTPVLVAPAADAEDTDNAFDKLNTYSTNLNELITNETTRITALSELYKAYDKLNASKDSPDGITNAQKQILVEHLNDNIKIIESKRNLSLAQAEQQIAKLNSDAAVANTVKTIRNTTDPVLSPYVAKYNVPKNE